VLRSRKDLNVEQVASLEKIQTNNEIKNLLATLGCGVGAHFDLNKLRYNRVILMTDADVDGAHISVCSSPLYTGTCRS
jgi:DNA gyrase subunit B